MNGYSIAAALGEQHRAELLCQAEQYRLIRAAKARPDRCATFRLALLRRLSRILPRDHELQTRPSGTQLGCEGR